MEIFNSDKAPKAIGPYSQAIAAGNLLYCSGQTPVNPVTMKIETSDAGTQTQQAIFNLETVLHEAGLTLTDVIRTNVYLQEMENFAEMNSAYAECFGMHRPVRTTVAVKGLPYNALVEIDCIAVFNNNIQH